MFILFNFNSESYKMKSPVKRAAAVHDLSGFGRASLTVVTPILSTMGIQVCPLPTAVLSTHGKFKGYHFVDLTDHMQPIIDHWKKLDIEFDAIYTGFLGSHRQIDIVRDFIDDFKSNRTIVIVDPVLGDNGKIYGPLNTDVVNEMKKLVAHADIITPNLTELAFLLDKKYNPSIGIDELKQDILTLSTTGPGIVIVTSVPSDQANLNGEAKATSVIAYNKKGKRFWRVSCSYLPADFPGTGDAFASVVTGSLLQGDSLPIALDRAVQFISLGVRATFGYEYNPDEGILLERMLPSLNAPVQISSYEIVD